MNVLQLVKQLMAKDSPFKRIIGLNKEGTTRRDVVEVLMSFVQQEWITRAIDAAHKEYQRRLAGLPQGHLLEIRLLPDVERKQLKIVVEDVCGAERKILHTLYSRDITPAEIEKQAVVLLGGAEAMAEPFSISDLTKK